MRSGFHADRLSIGEWLGLLSGVALALALTLGGTGALSWHHRSTALSVLCALVAVLCAVVFLTTALRPSPALALVSTVIQTPFACVLAIWLALVVLTGSSSGAGLYIALAAALLELIAIYLSFRRDGIPLGDAPQSIETLNIAQLPLTRRADLPE